MPDLHTQGKHPAPRLAPALEGDSDAETNQWCREQPGRPSELASELPLLPVANSVCGSIQNSFSVVVINLGS